MHTARRGRLPLNRHDGLLRGRAISIHVDGEPVEAYAGETVAAVLVADRGLATRRTQSGAPRGVFCGIGLCFDCLVVVNGVPNTRACMTLVEDGMTVQLQGPPLGANSAAVDKFSIREDVRQANTS